MGVLRSVEAIAEVQKEGACDEGLEREGGVEARRVVATLMQVDAKTCAEGEDWGINLASERKARLYLLP